LRQVQKLAVPMPSARQNPATPSGLPSPWAIIACHCARLRKLFAIHPASAVDVLRVPPGNRLHMLEGDRAGQHSISVNDQRPIYFRFEDDDAYDVEMCDYQ
jgi:plasmid maintenance system killer protein